MTAVSTTGYEAWSSIPLEKQEYPPLKGPNLYDMLERMFGERQFGLEDFYPAASSPDHQESEIETKHIISLAGTRFTTYHDILTRRGPKYADFFALLNSIRFDGVIRSPRQKAVIVDAVYIAMRILDDVIDGDAPRHMLSQDRLAYIQTRIDAIEGNIPFDPSNPVDAFVLKALETAQHIGLDIRGPLLKIVRSMFFDARRILTFEQSDKREPEWEIFCREELKEHFFDLDSHGTVGGMLLLFDVELSPENVAILAPISEATRIYYNLRDLIHELRMGMCNICREDMKHYGITQQHLRQLTHLETTVADGDPSNILDFDISHFPVPVRDWIQAEMDRGQHLVDAYVHVHSRRRFTGVHAPWWIPNRLSTALHKKVVSHGFTAPAQTFFHKLKALFKHRF